MQTSSLSFFLLGLLATLALAAPPNIQKRSFIVERVPNSRFVARNGARSLIKAYRKYSMPVPPELAHAIQAQALAQAQAQAESEKSSIKAEGTGGEGTTPATGATPGTTPAAGNGTGTGGGAGTGIVVATPEAGDIEYLIPINVGNQTVIVDGDTGSADLWVVSTLVPTAQRAGHANIFDPSKSTTWKQIQGATFTISYGDGSGATGNVGIDKVTVGGVTFDTQGVEVATAMSQSFTEDTANQGLLGLAFSKLNTVKPTKVKTFFENVMPTLAMPLFTADLRKNVPGAYEFGRIDTSKFTGPMTWVTINNTQGFWQFSTGGYGVGTGAMKTTAPGQAIADTGTTLLLVSKEVANGYYSQVQGAKNDNDAGGMTVPCSATLPDLMLDVGGGYMARIKGSDINYANVDAKTCFGGVQATTSGLQIWGDIFFKSQFVAFNAGNNSLGLAQHV